MPKLLTTTDMQTGNIPGLRGYQFSAVRTTKLTASEYTLVTITVDVSTSVDPFRDLLVDSVKKAVRACQKSPRANNLLVRVVTFSTSVREIHGFKPLSEIDVDQDYEAIQTGGYTALYDATASSIGAMTEYGRVLIAQDYGVNAIQFVITDGDDNRSTYTPAVVREKAVEATSGEILESLVSVLIGVNVGEPQIKTYLEDFQREAGLTQFIDAGDATPGNLAKLAAFVSRSVSSQANAQGSGAAAALPPPGTGTVTF